MHQETKSAVSGVPPKSDLDVDGDIVTKQPAVQNLIPNHKGHIVLSLFPDFHIGNNSMDPRSYLTPSQGSLSMETKRREQMMADLWSHSHGVSQNQFLSVVRELKKTKTAMKELQQKLADYKNTSFGDKQSEATSFLEEKVKAQQSEIRDLKQRIENLQVHKKHMKNDIEGISVAPASNSLEISRNSRENSFSKEDSEVSRREKQLQDEIHNWKQKVEHMKRENAEMKENYARLEKRLENEKFSSMQKWSELSTENAKFRKELNLAEEDRKVFLEQVDRLLNQDKEKDRRLQRLQESYEQVIQDRNVCEQRIAELKARQLEETNPFYHRARQGAHSNYHEEGSRTHSTVQDLQEALNKVKRQPSHSPRTYRCDRCYEEFIVEQDYLEHIQKCYD
ncbi:microtubule-associated tumor suppressor 1 homolog A-like [Saccostrea cucullata]|uniref:microtubule-associated tumor suppressor 1 homolog A-like n=1 Tax=Saccostrea cuccullata TaxID=36930 RepID=UPI002ED5030B